MVVEVVIVVVVVAVVVVDDVVVVVVDVVVVDVVVVDVVVVDVVVVDVVVVAVVVVVVVVNVVVVVVVVVVELVVVVVVVDVTVVVVVAVIVVVVVAVVVVVIVVVVVMVVLLLLVEEDDVVLVVVFDDVVVCVDVDVVEVVVLELLALVLVLVIVMLLLLVEEDDIVLVVDDVVVVVVSHGSKFTWSMITSRTQLSSSAKSSIAVDSVVDQFDGSASEGTSKIHPMRTRCTLTLAAFARPNALSARALSDGGPSVSTTSVWGRADDGSLSLNIDIAASTPRCRFVSLPVLSCTMDEAYPFATARSPVSRPEPILDTLLANLTMPTRIPASRGSSPTSPSRNDKNGPHCPGLIDAELSTSRIRSASDAFLQHSYGHVRGKHRVRLRVTVVVVVVVVVVAVFVVVVVAVVVVVVSHGS